MLYLLLFLVLVCVLLLIQPLPTLLYYKYKYGKKVALLYFPIWGLFYYIFRNTKKYDDPIKELHDLQVQHPEVEVIITNNRFRVFLIFLKTHLYKEFLINHERYVKYKILPDKRVIDKGMIIESGERWRAQKQLLGQHFQYNQLISRLPMFNQVIKEKILNRKFEGDIFPALDVASSIAGDILMRSFFGEQAAGQNIDGMDQANCVNQLTKNFGYLQYKSMFFFIKWAILGEYCWKILKQPQEVEIYQFTTKVLDHMSSLIQTRLQQLVNKQRMPTENFLDIYLMAYIQKKDPNLTMDEVVQQCNTLFFAGTETTANLINNSVYFLAIYPELQEQLHQEISTVLQNEIEVTAKHLSQLQKVHSFLLESLRLKPVVEAPVARIAQVGHFIGEYYVRKGDIVNFFSSGLRYDPKNFEDPEVINLNRWSVEGKSSNPDLDPFVSIPFSAGSRNCIGQHMAMIEAKIIMCYLIRQFEFYPNPEFPRPKWEIRVTQGLQNFGFIKFRHRKSE